MQYTPISILAAPASSKAALIILIVISIALALSSVIFTMMSAKSKNLTNSKLLLLGAFYVATIVAIVCTIICISNYTNTTDDSLNVPDTSATEETEPPTLPNDPSNWGIDWEIIVGTNIVGSYNRENPISFGKPSEYTQMEGIITFRGDNYRSGATYGTANVVNEIISEKWSSNISTLNGWPGSGWTGQPLIVRWDEQTKSIMNLYEEKKAKEDLVEVIYATLDGNIYFFDLDDGSYTRDPLFIGMNFKGAGALDPRGYPLMYVGSGDYYNGKAPRMYIISLIDGSVLFERTGSDGFTLRSDWAAFDSSPLVDAETDTLIWPGESGILYTITLNTVYDAAVGTISIDPEETVKTRYQTPRANADSYWLGYEPSAVIVDRYLYISENGGMFYCVDLNTMELVWAQDTKDDSNSTPVFQMDADGNGYIYTAPSLHWTADENSQGPISIYKLNAQTGDIVWERSFNCHTVSGVSGGVQSTPLLGKPGTDIAGLIIYSVARTPSVKSGVLVALDTETGEVVWQYDMTEYTWSSPTAVYTDDNKAYVVICDSAGKAALLEGATGTVLDTVSLGSNVEASPAIFEDTVVVGTRGKKIYALKVQ